MQLYYLHKKGVLRKNYVMFIQITKVVIKFLPTRKDPAKKPHCCMQGTYDTLIACREPLGLSEVLLSLVPGAESVTPLKRAFTPLKRARDKDGMVRVQD